MSQYCNLVINVRNLVLVAFVHNGVETLRNLPEMRCCACGELIGFSKAPQRTWIKL